MSKLIDIPRTLLKSACVVMLAACNPVKIPTAEAVASDPNRMKEIMRQCKIEWAKVGDATCTAVSETWRRRFMGNSGARNASSSTQALTPGQSQAAGN